jgi:hypothetical protein
MEQEKPLSKSLGERIDTILSEKNLKGPYLHIDIQNHQKITISVDSSMEQEKPFNSFDSLGECRHNFH